jgi:hypothetical protein
MNRRSDLDQFYQALFELKQRVGGYRYLRDCSGKSGWPHRGVYFFFEQGEFREDGSTPRVVRVGTHAVSQGSRTTLWDRLHTHKGHSDGRGNHRGSIFRKRIGESLLATGQCGQQFQETWGKGSSAPKITCIAEQPLEIEVSRYIGAMPFLWLEIGDDPCKESHRAVVERNTIALLSNFEKAPIDPPSALWLGLKCSQETIRNSGLWNTNHVDEGYGSECLQLLYGYVCKM